MKISADFTVIPDAFAKAAGPLCEAARDAIG